MKFKFKCGRGCKNAGLEQHIMNAHVIRLVLGTGFDMEDGPTYGTVEISAPAGSWITWHCSVCGRLQAESVEELIEVAKAKGWVKYA